MAAPQFTPTPVVDTARAYGSPDVVPHAWSPDRPGDIVGFQPSGDRLGYQGPDQGFAIKIANGFKDRLQLQPGEHAADAIKGCLGVGLRRASMFSRAPVVHDLTIAFTIWGFLAWKFVDGRGRARWRNHAEVVFFGLVFSVGIETVQFFLPTRAADVNDVFWNAVGALLGALLAHLHASVRVEWT